MAPQRRHNHPKTPNKGGSNRAQFFKPSQATSATPPALSHSTPTSGLGMTTAQRYEMNLKLMRRREPTITSIFDQFDHVCVYKIDANGKWDKAGYEGSMFLFESTSYPPYGIYILNRASSRDLVQRLYPEDSLKVSGSILAIKHYKSFSKNRIDAVKTQYGDNIISCPSHPAFVIEDVENLSVDVKGEHEMIGFWKHEAGHRTSMIEVVQRLHACIMKNQPYPEAWRYGPDHPPPHHRLQMTPHQSSASEGSESASASECDSDTGDPPPPSEVDLLFAKLLPTPVVSRSVVVAQPQQPQQPQHTPSAVDSLFAKLTSVAPTVTPGPAPPPPQTGLSLLNSIFASAQAQPTQQPAEIHAPQPTTQQPHQQQVLNENVISILLGLPASRSASAAGSTTTSRDGDNESDSSGFSNDSISNRPGALAVPRTSKPAAVRGDATPRPFATIPINGHANVPAPSLMESVSSVSTVRGSSFQPQVQQVQLQKPRANRQLVPFEDDSELWPYTPSSNAENGANGHGKGNGSDDADIVELDFSETNLLTDPDGFNNRLRNQTGATNDEGSSRKNRRTRTKRKPKGQQSMEEIERGWDIPDSRSAYLAAQRADEIEQQEANLRINGSAAAAIPPPPASPSPPPDVVLKGRQPRTPSPVANLGQSHDFGSETPTMGSRVQEQPKANGREVPTTPSSKSKGKKAVVNGSGVNRQVVAGSILQSMGLKKARAISKDAFVKDIMALFQTDQAFVDEVYQRYTSQAA